MIRNICNRKKGWDYEMVISYTDLGGIFSPSLNYVIFKVYFDGKGISKRILGEIPSEEECLSMMCNTKEGFIRSQIKK